MKIIGRWPSTPVAFNTKCKNIKQFSGRRAGVMRSRGLADMHTTQLCLVAAAACSDKSDQLLDSSSSSQDAIIHFERSGGHQNRPIFAGFLSGN